MRHFWLFITIWFGLASALNAQGHCSAPSVSLTFSPAMLNFDNKGQSFVSAHHGENITSLTEITRKLTACTTRNSTPTLRRLALFAQVLTSFRLQYANAYVLHEYAHAEMGHRFGTSGIMIGRSPNNDGLGPTQNDAYLQNLLRMAFGGKHPFDFAYRGVGINSTGATPEAFSGPKAQALGHAAGINLNSFLAQQDFEAMMDGEVSPSRGLNYIINKTFAPGYFMLDANIGGDPSNYVAQLTAQGITTSVDKIRKYQWAALLLSNGYWSSLRSLRHYSQEVVDIAPIVGRLAVMTRSPNTVLYWPEFSTFLNKSGVSMAGELPFTLGPKGRWNLGVERNIIGMNEDTDITLGLKQTFNNVKISGKFTQNTQSGSFAEARLQREVTKNISMIAQIFWTKGTSLIGERLSFGASQGGHFGFKFTF